MLTEITFSFSFSCAKGTGTTLLKHDFFLKYAIWHRSSCVNMMHVKLIVSLHTTIQVSRFIQSLQRLLLFMSMG